jgi:hypothetical protein
VFDTCLDCSRFISILVQHQSVADVLSRFPTHISDIEYEQVIGDRYLFGLFANESTFWNVLNKVGYVWHVAALPSYHSQATEGIWLLSQTTTGGTLQMSWMSLSGDGSLVVLSEINVKKNLYSIGLLLHKILKQGRN